MKLTKLKLEEIIMEELEEAYRSVGYGIGDPEKQKPPYKEPVFHGFEDPAEEEPEYEKNWVVRRSGVHDSEAYMGNNWKWGPPEDAWRVEFEAEAKGTINYGVASGKIESGQPVELSSVEPLRLGRPEHDPLDTSPRGIRNRRRLQGRGIKNYPLDK